MVVEAKSTSGNRTHTKHGNHNTQSNPPDSLERVVSAKSSSMNRRRGNDDHNHHTVLHDEFSTFYVNIDSKQEKKPFVQVPGLLQGSLAKLGGVPGCRPGSRKSRV